MAEALDRLNLIFQKYSIQDLAGITLMHRHYDLSEDEVLVEELIGGVSTTTPKLKTATLQILPHSWKFAFSTTGISLTPVEFVDVSEPTTRSDLNTKISSVLTNQAFLVELYHALAELKLIDVLGLTILHRNDLTTVELPMLTEASTDSHAGRCSVLRPVTEEEGMDGDAVPTTWRFPVGKGIIKVDTCGGRWACSQICNTCGRTSCIC